MNEEKLADALEMWIQGRINNCVMGLLDRVERLERERENADMVIRALSQRIEDLEDRLVETAPDQALPGFTDRVIEVFNSEAFSDAVQSYIDYSDVLTRQGLEDALEDIAFNLRVR